MPRLLSGSIVYLYFANMCYRTKLNANLQEIEKTFEAQFIEPDAYRPMEEINAFDFINTPVITDENRGEIQFFNWGLSRSGRKTIPLKR